MPTSKRIHKNGSVAYQASDHTPHFPSLSKTFATRKAAREWLAAVHGERRRSLNYDPKQNACMSLGEAMQKYTAFKTPRKKGARQEMSLAKRWQKHPFALRPIGEILPFEFDGYVTARIETGAAASTILKELSLVSQVYDFVRQKLRMYAVINPIPDVGKPTAALPRTRRLSKKEEAKLLRFFASYGNRYVASGFIFAIETTIRRWTTTRPWKAAELIVTVFSGSDVPADIPVVVASQSIVINLLSILPPKTLLEVELMRQMAHYNKTDDTIRSQQWLTC